MEEKGKNGGEENPVDPAAGDPAAGDTSPHRFAIGAEMVLRQAILRQAIQARTDLQSVRKWLSVCNAF